ncbi:MAG: laminin B domain-containing protein [Lacipirellulaceae bacterium]
MKAYRCAWVCLSVVMGLSQAKGDVISTFDIDADGWTLFQNAGAPFGWVSSGGNPGGHITATDKTNDWAYVQAPAKFLAPALYGGVFAFDLRVDNLDAPPSFPGLFNVRVGLQGAGLTLINEGPLPTTSWNSFSFALDEAAGSGWRKFSNLSQNYSAGAPQATQSEMLAVLAGLTRVVIATDYTNAALDSVNQPIDQIFIDNVRLSEVPEPAAAAILASVCAALCSSRKHRAPQSWPPSRRSS